METRRIKEEVMVQQEISKSKFMTYLVPIESEDQAKEKLQEIRKLHPKANHHCSALIIGGIERSSDDGEPASSAGLPMLQTLRGHHLDAVLAVVVRYFGGTLLGVGGLIRAYGSSVRLAIEAAIFLSSKTVYQYKLRFPYDMIDIVEHGLKDYACIDERQYDTLVEYRVTLERVSILQDIFEQSKGMLKFEELKSYEQWVEGV